MISADFLSEFMAYFFPNLASYPDWLEFTAGAIVLSFFFRVICAVIARSRGNRL